MSRELVDTLLQELGQAMGIAGLRFDAARACQLLFDRRWLVTIVDAPAQSALTLHCPVADATRSAQLDTGMLRVLLRANFQAGGEALCVGPDERVYLQRLLPVGGPLPPGGLEAAVGQLLDHAERWSERLAREPAAEVRYPLGARA